MGEGGGQKHRIFASPRSQEYFIKLSKIVLQTKTKFWGTSANFQITQSIICKKYIINPFFSGLEKKSIFLAFLAHVRNFGVAFFEKLTFHPNIVFDKRKVSKVLRKKFFLSKSIILHNLGLFEVKNTSFFIRNGKYPITNFAKKG